MDPEDDFITGPLDSDPVVSEEPDDSALVTDPFSISSLFPPDTPPVRTDETIEDDLGIYSADWQMSAYRFGGVVEGSEDVNQAIMVALSTRKGSDPHRPDFGSDIWEQIDKPVNVAGPAIVRAVRNTVASWVPRVELQNVAYSYIDSFGDPNGPASGIRVDITWAPRAAASVSQILSLVVSTPEPGTPGGIIRILATESGQPIIAESGQYISFA